LETWIRLYWLLGYDILWLLGITSNGYNNILYLESSGMFFLGYECNGIAGKQERKLGISEFLVSLGIAYTENLGIKRHKLIPSEY